tara:strand:- start:2 stop:1666 length:1665 start_codon:yes stop_codon:yes gene_type:complete
MQDYTIQKGDYLVKIAKDAEISLRDLLKINPQIKDPNKIMPGEKIKLPSSYVPPPKFDDEDEFAQESYEDRIVEFFGHYIAAKVMLPLSKKAKRTAFAQLTELSSEYKQGKMPDDEGKQFSSGFTILKQLANSLGGEHRSQSSMGRYLTNNEVRPIEVKGYIVSRSDYQFFADAWQRVSMSEYDYAGDETSLTGKPMASVASAGNIFENYFKQNLKEEDISTSDNEVSELADIVVDEINAVFSQLPDGSPLKSREVALAALEQTKNISEQFMENYIMKNTNEGFMKNMLDKALGRSTDDDLKKRGAEFEKAVAAEEFFQLDDGRSQGAKGLILSMLDAMTPDHNVEYKGTGVEEGDAVDYVRGYLKKSWLGEIDAQPNKGKSEDADFSKYIDNNAWGEKITFDSLIQAATELYDRLRAEKMFEADIMLKYYSVPAGLLFYCLRNLGRSLMDMKKRYDKKRTASGIEENKIFENYFKQNLEEEDVDLDVNADTDLGQMVADMVNQALNTLEDTNPAKNRETGLDMIAQIRQSLQDPAVVGQIIEDEVQKMLAELA